MNWFAKHSVWGLMLLASVSTAQEGSQDSPQRRKLQNETWTKLEFYSSFDGTADANLSTGDGWVHLADSVKREKVQQGMPKHVEIAKGEGRFGDCLRFKRKAKEVLMYQGVDIPYAKTNWAGTYMFWMRLTPDTDLEPGYVDPLQITDKAWNDASFFVDFDKDLPRDFRLGVFPNYKDWNPENIDWDKLPVEKRPMVVVRKPPFQKDRWTHVAFTFENVNSSDQKPGRATLYLDGVVQGTIEREMKFDWNLEKTALMLGIDYIGDMDELYVFSSALTAEQIKLVADGVQPH